MQYHTRNFRILRRTIGKNIKHYRLYRQLSLEELGNKTRLNLLTIHKLEKGKTLPTIERLYRLACALDIPLEYLCHSREY